MRCFPRHSDCNTCQVVFWRQLASAPAAWLRENMQKLCPFGHKEANQLLAAKDQNQDGHHKPSLWGLLSGSSSKHTAPAAPARHSASLPPPPLPQNTTLAEPGDIVAVIWMSARVSWPRRLTSPPPTGDGGDGLPRLAHHRRASPAGCGHCLPPCITLTYGLCRRRTSHILQNVSRACSDFDRTARGAPFPHTSCESRIEEAIQLDLVAPRERLLPA